MKVLHLSTDDYSGGASRAAYRLHTALLQSGVASSMRVLQHQTANDRVIAGRAQRTFKEKVKNRLQQKFRKFSKRNWKTDNLIMHSFGQVSAGLVQEINDSDADVVNLHWIINLLSIDDIGRIKKPIVWTLHDMWAFCGGEHVVPDDDEHSRFRAGYLPDNRPAGESGPDLNRQTWQAKRQAWADQQFNIVTPGRWMAGCARESMLFRESPVNVIPNPLEMEHLWRPIPKQFARSVLGLDPHKKYVLSGSAGGMPHLKGEDLLRHAMNQFIGTQPGTVELLIFGQYRPRGAIDWSCPVHWLGPVKDDHVMSLIYSAADVMAVPSRQDNLPNTAVEAHACGVPVVAFNIGGLPDIVSHHNTGWLAPAFDTQDLAEGLSWVLADAGRWQQLSRAARQLAVERFSPSVITSQYMRVYDEALQQHKRVDVSASLHALCTK
jgi:glycosyltransferase involved in cell wall biosynthesis